MIVKIDSFDNLILFVLAFSMNFDFVLKLETYFVELFR